jgi:hypothetical protein
MPSMFLRGDGAVVFVSSPRVAGVYRARPERRSHPSSARVLSIYINGVVRGLDSSFNGSQYIVQTTVYILRTRYLLKVKTDCPFACSLTSNIEKRKLIVIRAICHLRSRGVVSD